MTHAPTILLLLKLLALMGTFEVSAEETRVVSLPPEIAQLIREANPGGRGGCPVSSIFVHGYHYLDHQSDRVLWFLGAPDYLCETNSFVSAIVDSNHTWTLGRADEAGWADGWRLSGTPTHFLYSAQFGYLVASAWQVEGPINFLYHSPDGVSWASVDLPVGAKRHDDTGCCYAPRIRRLCLADSGHLFVTYDEDDVFDAGIWSVSLADLSSETRSDWTQAQQLPDQRMSCDADFPAAYMPPALREKTADGAIFDIFWNRAIRIPGPTR